MSILDVANLGNHTSSYDIEPFIVD